MTLSFEHSSVFLRNLYIASPSDEHYPSLEPREASRILEQRSCPNTNHHKMVPYRSLVGRLDYAGNASFSKPRTLERNGGVGRHGYSGGWVDEIVVE